MTGETDPYAAPLGDLRTGGEGESWKVELLSAAGRLGRLRYLAYSLGFGLGLLAWLTMPALVAPLEGMFLGPNGLVFFLALWVVVVVPLLMVQVNLAVQRAHDFGAPGWMAFLAFIPFLHLALWLIPGTDGPNRHGDPAPPNGYALAFAGWLHPLLYGAALVDILLGLANGA
ncbi:MAG: DUF805 domain-containing protein [Thiohalorhabdus sp.]|uniref:DUF805 domain-containing protein n=1 Tax=Thiohalorhabdus sp. TaxID=3094134 RepID=UPI00397E9D31